VLPGQWGLFAAMVLEGGEVVGSMLDAEHVGVMPRSEARQVAEERVSSGAPNFLFELKASSSKHVKLYDGRVCRPGGPRCANDARGTGQHNNAIFYETGTLNVAPMVEVQRRRADMSAASLKRTEILCACAPRVLALIPPCPLALDSPCVRRAVS
jgi:hypothetical protein